MEKPLNDVWPEMEREKKQSAICASGCSTDCFFTQSNIFLVYSVVSVVNELSLPLSVGVPNARASERASGSPCLY